MRNFIAEILEAVQEAGITDDDVVCVGLPYYGRILWEQAKRTFTCSEYEPGNGEGKPFRVNPDSVIVLSGGSGTRYLRRSLQEDGCEGWEELEKVETPFLIPNKDVEPARILLES